MDDLDLDFDFGDMEAAEETTEAQEEPATQEDDMELDPVEEEPAPAPATTRGRGRPVGRTHAPRKLHPNVARDSAPAPAPAPAPVAAPGAAPALAELSAKMETLIQQNKKILQMLQDLKSAPASDTNANTNQALAAIRAVIAQGLTDIVSAIDNV